MRVAIRNCHSNQKNAAEFPRISGIELTCPSCCFYKLRTRYAGVLFRNTIQKLAGEIYSECGGKKKKTEARPRAVRIRVLESSADRAKKRTSSSLYSTRIRNTFGKLKELIQYSPDYRRQKTNALQSALRQLIQIGTPFTPIM